jgi:hypothetical protein
VTPAQVGKLFNKERARFARVYPWVADADLVILPGYCTSGKKCHERDLAYAMSKPMHVAIVRRLLDLPDRNVVGVIRHELGHLADKRLSDPGRERRADQIAEYVTGQRINYDANDIQTTGRGRSPRPGYLHR